MISDRLSQAAARYKVTLKPAGEIKPAAEFNLPSLGQIWPVVEQIYNGEKPAWATNLPHSSPQAQSDIALGLAVILSNETTINETGTEIWYESGVLTNFTLNNVSNINQLPPYPPSQNDTALEQWVLQQLPDLTEADIFPTGKNGLGDYFLWGMACRQLLASNGWDTSGITYSYVLPPWKANLYVDGRFLYDRYRNQVILRGVNYPLLDDWQFPPNSYLSEIAQSGANAIRIQWYVNYNQADGVTRDPSYSTADLGTFLDACIAAKIVPIVMLADDTCNSDPTLINSFYVPWWTDPANADVLKARQECLILNLANELGYWEWADDPASALTAYTSAYKTAIASMRAAGYTCPLMIDAPDCGSKLSAFTAAGDGGLTVGAELVAADPLGNILLSAHAYWAGYDGRPFIPTAIAANLPIVFGEIANKQDEVVNGNTVYGYYDLDGTHVGHPTSTGFTYQSFLTSLVPDQIGWLAWCWTKDICDARQMTPTGEFANLGTFGSDLVNNATYGLKATAVKITT
jgi:mannan endo-1,4-beta-mannosidase